MIKGPWPLSADQTHHEIPLKGSALTPMWPLSADQTHHEIPLKGSALTPMFRGERVALRVSAEDEAKFQRGPGVHGVVTDLDTQKRYTLMGMPCEAGGSCYCDAEILEALTDPKEGA